MPAETSESPLPAYTDVVPYSRTALRLTWAHLPPELRDEIGRRCGAPVVEAQSRDSGFTPGFASVLVCEDGSRHFVKAASVKGQRAFAASYREEANKLAALPPGVPAPRLLWTIDDDTWMVLGIEHHDGVLPARPWRTAEVEACLDALEVVADLLTPPPAGLELPVFLEEFADMSKSWEHVLATQADLEHAADAAALAARLPEVVAGDTVVHTDVRADNVLVGEDGRAAFCDWNWLARGPAWFDTVFFLLEPYGDGLPADDLLRSRRLTRDVPDDSVDIVLAALVGFFSKAADAPVPASSPHVRDHQAWMRDVTWQWLWARRGWS